MLSKMPSRVGHDAQEGNTGNKIVGGKDWKIEKNIRNGGRKMMFVLIDDLKTTLKCFSIYHIEIKKLKNKMRSNVVVFYCDRFLFSIIN